MHDGKEVISCYKLIIVLTSCDRTVDSAVATRHAACRYDPPIKNLKNVMYFTLCFYMIDISYTAFHIWTFIQYFYNYVS
jgi:hypothetical protein